MVMNPPWHSTVYASHVTPHEDHTGGQGPQKGEVNQSGWTITKEIMFRTHELKGKTNVLLDTSAPLAIGKAVDCPRRSDVCLNG